MERKKILVLSDHPLLPSGVGLQTKYLIEGLLRTGKYKFVCLGGALKHVSMQPQMVDPEQFGEGNWIIHPVVNHGNKELVRKFLVSEKPDAVLMVTDPRFFVWLWEIEDEVRSVCPLMYWHVWDNDPSPDFNSIFYNSTDYIGCISLKTYGILQDLKYPEDRFDYIPHALPEELFKPLPDEEVAQFKVEHYGPHADKRFVVMWNNRNARRKQTGDVVGSFAKFAHEVGLDKTALFMHTAVHDPEGQDIIALGRKFGIEKNLIISEQRLDSSVINSFYNVADCVINIASNEGFGLATLEALYAGTPIIAHMTGGLQFQVGDWWESVTDFSDQDDLEALARRLWNNKKSNWWGVPVFSASRSCTGSQEIPYIYDDRAAHKDVIVALHSVYSMGRSKRKELGKRAREWALRKFGMGQMILSWDSAIEKTIESFRPVGLRHSYL
jgi:glycosyltransferase involved in cell wall biosynthesis